MILTILTNLALIHLSFFYYFELELENSSNSATQTKKIIQEIKIPVRFELATS